MYDSENGKLIKPEGSTRKTGNDLVEHENGNYGNNGNSEMGLESNGDTDSKPEEKETQDKTNGEEEVCILVVYSVSIDSLVISFHIHVVSIACYKYGYPCNTY